MVEFVLFGFVCS